MTIYNGLGVSGNVTLTDSIIHDGDTDTKIRFPAADQFSVETGGSTRLSVTNTGASVTGNLNVTGVLTYDDVTNIDSVGIVTARSGVFIPDNNELKIGNTAGSPDTKIFHNGSKTRLVSTVQYDMDADIIDIHNASANAMKARFLNNQVELYYANNKKFETTSTGVDVTGTITMDAVPGTNTNAALPVLFQTSSGTIDGGSQLTYNPSQDLLSVNGLGLTVNQILGGGNTLVLAAANYSSTSQISITNKVNILVEDNATDAFTVKQGSNEYITVDTNNSNELITLGNTTTNPNVSILAGTSTFSGDITVPTSMDSTATGGVAIQRFWNTGTITNGNVYKCGMWYTGEGTIQLLIAVRSHTAGNSGTTTYMFQGSFSAIGSLGIKRLMPLTVGTGHGNGPDLSLIHI